MAGLLFSALGGSYPVIGTFAAFIYASGMIAVFWAPDTSSNNMDDSRWVQRSSATLFAVGCCLLNITPHS